MIALLHGPVASIAADSIVVEVGGVGFQVYLPAPFKDRLQVGEVVFLHTRLVVRQDLLALYGFETPESRDFFDLLLGVSGVGPRSALAILSTLSPEAIRRAVFNEQAEIFSRVPGIGKKTAQKIFLDLKDRLPRSEALAPLEALSETDSEVLAALTALGYSLVEAQAALQTIPRQAPPDLETRLRLALQYFSPPPRP